MSFKGAADQRALKSSTPKISYPPGCRELSEELSNDELIKRLKALARVFQDLGQEENTASEYKDLALYLATEYFLEHPSKDVRLLVACCIADIFRVFAPEAPYTDPEQIKEIFLFLTQQLKGLDDVEAPSYKRNFYLLENLAWVKSFNICLELDDSSDVIASLFKTLLSTVNDKHSGKVTGFMLDLMCPLVTEAETVSTDLVDVILSYILEPKKTKNKPAYTLARELLVRTASSLEPSMQLYLSNLLMPAGKSPTTPDLSDRILDLIAELQTFAPAALVSVLPQLELKLKSSDEAERLAVTRMLSKMFSTSGPEFVEKYRPLWASFLSRFNDIEISVRRLCVQSSQEFIVNFPELVREEAGGGGLNISEHLRQRQHDSDESVRSEVVQAIIGAAKKKLSNVSEELLECVRERTLDKKFKIRKEALLGLGLIYRQCCDGNGDRDNMPWIRNKILHAYYQNSLDDKLLVERILNVSLVPYSLEPTERMKRLYILYGNLDAHAIKVLQEIFRTQLVLRNLVSTLADALLRPGIDENSPIVTGKLQQLSRYLVPANKPQEHMKHFAELLRTDVRVRLCITRLVAPDCSCKKAEEYVKEILKKGGNPVPSNLFYANMKQLLERIAPVMIDGAAVDALLKLVDEAVIAKNGDEREIVSLLPNAVEMGVNLLLLLSQVYPGSFQTENVYRQLMVFVRYDDDVVSDTTMQIFRNVGQNLELTHPEIHKSLLPALLKMVKYGTVKQAKHAVRCLDTMYPKTKDEIFKQLYEHVETNMNVESSSFHTALAALGHITQLSPSAFAASTGNIVSRFIVKEVLMQNRTETRRMADAWCADHLVGDETRSKIIGMKTIIRWLLGIRGANGNVASPTLRLLYSTILCEGDLMERGLINKAEMARLRLQAGCCMLKLAEEPIYADVVRLEQFQTMALLVNDPCEEVRQRFVQKLHKGLISLRLPLPYLAVLSLGALDPLKERRASVKQLLTNNITRRRDYARQKPATVGGSGNASTPQIPDFVMPHVIHLLAHDPDLSSYNDTKALKSINDCLWYVLEPLTSKNEDCSYVFYQKMFEMIKQMKDAQCPDSEENNMKLYAVADLALQLLSTKVTSSSLADINIEPVLPPKLFIKYDSDTYAGRLPADGGAKKSDGSGAEKGSKNVTYTPSPVGDKAESEENDEEDKDREEEEEEEDDDSPSAKKKTKKTKDMVIKSSSTTVKKRGRPRSGDSKETPPSSSSSSRAGSKRSASTSVTKPTTSAASKGKRSSLNNGTSESESESSAKKTKNKKK